MDADLTSLVRAGDANSEVNLDFEGGLGSTAFAVLDRVSLTIVLSDTLRIGELSFIGDPGATSSSEAGSVATSNGHNVEISASCGYSWVQTDRVSDLGSGDPSFFRIVLRWIEDALCRAMTN